MRARMTTTGLVGVLAALGVVVAPTTVIAQSPAPPSQAEAASPGQAVAASPSQVASPDPALAATCLSFEAQPERCYLVGEAHVTLRGAIRRSLEVPLLWGVNASSDFVPSISLHFEDPDVASLVIDLPGVPGASTTPADGDSATQGETQVWWSLHGGSDSRRPPGGLRARLQRVGARCRRPSSSGRRRPPRRWVASSRCASSAPSTASSIAAARCPTAARSTWAWTGRHARPPVSASGTRSGVVVSRADDRGAGGAAGEAGGPGRRT